MKITKQAYSVLEDIINECDGDLFTVAEEYYCSGICRKCGNIQDGAEPDATDYECEECGTNAVTGFETALMLL